MSDQTPPRTTQLWRKFVDRYGTPHGNWRDIAYEVRDHSHQLERELAAASAERDEARRERDGAQSTLRIATENVKALEDQRDAAIAQVAELETCLEASVAQNVEADISMQGLFAERDQLRAQVERLRDSGSIMLGEIGKLFWTSSDGVSVRDGTPEDSDAPLSFTAAWKSFQAALTGEKGDK